MYNRLNVTARKCVRACVYVSVVPAAATGHFVELGSIEVSCPARSQHESFNQTGITEG